MNRTFVLNGTLVNARPITTNMMCQFSEEGLDLSKMGTQPWIFARSYVAKCLNISLAEAGKRLDAHFNSGGDLSDIMTPFSEEAADSGFFSSDQQDGGQDNSAGVGRSGVSRWGEFLNINEVKDLRSYFEKHWLPEALSIGMSERQFWGTNPRKYGIYVEAFIRTQRMQDRNNWLMGRYIAEAVASVLSDSKHPYRYPEKPYLEAEEECRIIDATNMTEEEKEAGRRQWMQLMGYNFEEIATD